jgi:uncharacterized protein (DUF2344 family)
MFIAESTLSITEKINILLQHEIDIWDKETKTEKAHIVKFSAKVSKYHYQHSNCDSEEGSLI